MTGQDGKHLPALASIALLLAAAPACSRHIEEQDEPVRFARRMEPCTDWCETVHDPECPAADALANVDDCVDHCTSEEAVNWGLQPDGTDACFDEQTELFACLGETTCESRHDLWDRPLEWRTHTCNRVLDPLFACVADN